MILAYHVIFSTYGFWLPNDPRGSWSEFVGSWELARFGRATKVSTRRSVAHSPHDHNLRAKAKRHLKHPPVEFTGQQAREVGNAFARFAVQQSLPVHACSILPGHVHLVIGRHNQRIEQTIILLKGEGTRRLIQLGLHPCAHLPFSKGRPPSMWSRGGWKVYLDSVPAVLAAIRYVEENFVREGKQRQEWSFVVPFER